MIAALCAAALAGWVREPGLGPTEAVVIEPRVGAGVLLRVHPPDVPFTVTDAGVPVPLRAGRDHTVWIAPTDRTRTLLLSAEAPVEVETWRDAPTGEAAAWTRYARGVARWCHVGGALPQAPGPLDGLDARWVLREELARARGEEDPRRCAAAAWVELEAVRARGGSDHTRSEGPEVEVAPGDTVRDEVRGPGVWVVEARPVLGVGIARGAVRLTARLDGVPVARVDRTAGVDPDEPGLGWARRLEVVVPPGDHRVAVDVEGDPVLVRARSERLRLPVGRAGLMRHLSSPAPGALWELESAALLARPDAVALAEALLDTPVADLARARYVALHPEGEVVAARVGEALGPVSRAAWARRARVRRDLPLDPLIDDPADWLVDPTDVGWALHEVDPSAVRPRDAAARRIADRHVVSTGTIRWGALFPEGEAVPERIPGALGGVRRVRVDAGQLATVTVPDHGGGLGALRLEAEAPVRYRVDGVARHGLGRLDLAVPAGEHAVLVDQGRLWVLDGDQARGGLVAQEVPTAALPASWVVPEPGFPVRVAISAVQPGAALIVETDDGRAWPVQAGEAPAVIDVGPRAARVTVSGPPGARVAVAMQRSVVDPPLALPTVAGEPLARVAAISQKLVVAPPPDGPALAELRLERAAALVALGLVGTARRELNAIAAIPGATPRQRALAGTPLPPTFEADAPGPLTAAAALAEVGRLPPADPSGRAWMDAARDLPAHLADAVLAEAARRLWEEGDPALAWTAGERGGERAQAVLDAISASGRWERLSRVEAHGGAVREAVRRVPPGPEDGVYAQVREALLGAPWDPATYAVLRGGRRDRLVLQGPAEVEVQLLCRDEALSAEPLACRVELSLDGEARAVKVDEGAIGAHTLSLGPGEHELLVDPRRRGTNAVAVRVVRDGVVLPPSAEIAAHLVGGGVRTTVAGPALVRARVLRGAPVEVRVGERVRTVADEVVLPILGAEPVVVEVRGPPASWVDLARWEPLPPELAPPPLPEPERYVAPEAIGPVAEASRAWVGALRRAPTPGGAPPGPPGTVEFSAAVRDDAVGARDEVRHYRVGDVEAGLRAALGPRLWGRTWLRARLSPDGPAAAGGGARAWAEAGPWRVEGGLSGYGSVGAGHVRGDVDVARELLADARWRVDGFAGLRLGAWTRDAPVDVDPLVWTVFARDHAAGLTLGGEAEWRPALDLRARATLQAVSNAGASLDRVEARMRGDLLARDEILFTALAELGLRLRDEDRSRAQVRPLLGADVSWSAWPARHSRVVVEAGLRWLPAIGVAEGGLSLGWEGSRARGLLDRAPAAVLFRDLLDLPQDRP